MRRAVVLLFGLFASGCFVDRGGLARHDGGVEPPPVEAGPRDAASLDASPRDARPPDTGTPDAGPPDTGAPDAGPPFCDSSDPSLVLCLRCEGEVRDESAAANALTASEVSFDAGPVGDACHLVSESRVIAPAASALDVAELTLEAFVILDALPTGSARVGIADKNGIFGLFVYDGGRLRCTGGGANAEAPGAVSAGRWHHVACVIAASGAALYVDGAVVDEQPGATLGVNGEALHVGSNSPDGASPLIGAVDELRVFAIPRDAGTIAAAAARR